MDAAANSSIRGRSPADYQFPINESSLPVDISKQEAKLLQEHVRQVGHAWYKTSTVKVEFCYISKAQFEQGDVKPEELLCESELEVEQALKIINPAKTIVLIIIHSSDIKSSGESGSAPTPCTTLPVMLSLCRHFEILPTYTLMMEQSPGFRLHLRTNIQGKGKLPEGDWSRDFCYAAPMPWFPKDLPSLSTNMQQLLFTISSYGRITSGVPTLTLFSTIPASLVPAIKSSWLASVDNISHGITYQLHEHFTLFALSAYKLQDGIRLWEMFQALYGEIRLELHVENARGDIEKTIKKSREFTGQMNWLRVSIVNTEEILKKLQKILLMDEQTTAWSDNLFAQLGFVRRRIEDILDKHKAAETTVLSYIALRDSQALAHNTKEMTIMARATEKSGEEMSIMTRGMERDARLMKFLAEITALFLPLTAIATIFSMPFFSVTAPSSGIVPIFSMAVYSWVYFTIVGMISVMVFGWWAYKHYEIRSKSTSDNDQDAEAVDTDETSLTAQKSLNTSQNKLLAMLIYKEAKAELEAIEKESLGDDGEEDLSQPWSKMQGDALTKLLIAGRALETGEDVQKLLQSVTSRQNREESQGIDVIKQTN